VRLRKGFLVLALAALVLCVAGELGAGVWRPSPPALAVSGEPSTVVKFSGTQLSGTAATVRDEPARHPLARPGLAISYLALVDVLLVLTVAFITAAILLPQRALAPVHAVTSLVASLLVLLASVLCFLLALGLTLTMVGLFLAFPFGTAVYLGLWGTFPVGMAAATLGALLFLKLAYGVGLVLAHPRFLENRGLVFLSVVSLVATVLAQFLQGLPPGIAASITDGVAAIVIAILGAICAIVVLVWSVVALVRLVLAARLAVT
jgi:hypothetical protein